MRLSCVLVALCLTVANGWSSESHKIVARIASKLMSKKAQRYVRDHLPKRDGTKFPHSESALVLHASWADSVANMPGYEWSQTMHFVDTPLNRCGAYNETRDCREGNCIVTAIANYTARAADIALPIDERSEALKFVLHLIADAHSGMHVAFEDDHGGNEIHLVSPEMSLHEVWDSELLKSFKDAHDNQALQSWPRLSSELIAQLLNNSEMREAYLLPHAVTSVATAHAFAAAIVSETSTEVTCPLAYWDEGRRIPRRAHRLSEEYMMTRSMRAIEQLMRAGVRLAQLLDEVAGVFYFRENVASAAFVEAADGNPFESLRIDFDADEWVHDPAAEGEAGDDSDLERIDAEAESGDAPVACPEAPVAPVAPMTSSAKKRMKRKAAAARPFHAPPVMVDGVDVSTLVLIKLDGRFVITSRSNVATLMSGGPVEMAAMVGIQFSNSAHLTHFVLDASVFQTVVTLTLLEATFLHLKGVEAGYMSVCEQALRFSAGSPVNKVTHCDIVMLPGLTSVMADEAMKPEMKVKNASSLAGFVHVPLSEAALLAKYRGKLPTTERRIRDLFMVHGNNLLVYRHNKIVLVALASDVADLEKARWVLNHQRIGKWNALIDARIVDELVPESVFADLVKLVFRPFMQTNKARVEASRHRLIQTLDELETYVIEGESSMSLLALSVPCERVNRVPRDHFQSLDIVLRTLADSQRCVHLAMAGLVGELDVANPFFQHLCGMDAGFMARVVENSKAVKARELIPGDASSAKI